MRREQALIRELEIKYGEWLEHAGDKAPHVMINLLATLLVREKDKVSYYRKLTLCHCKEKHATAN